MRQEGVVKETREDNDDDLLSEIKTHPKASATQKMIHLGYWTVVAAITAPHRQNALSQFQLELLAGACTPLGLLWPPSFQCGWFPMELQHTMMGPLDACKQQS